jgi:hypothetical protein
MNDYFRFCGWQKVKSLFEKSQINPFFLFIFCRHVFHLLWNVVDWNGLRTDFHSRNKKQIFGGNSRNLSKEI